MQGLKTKSNWLRTPRECSKTNRSGLTGKMSLFTEQKFRIPIYRPNCRILIARGLKTALCGLQAPLIFLYIGICICMYICTLSPNQKNPAQIGRILEQRAELSPWFQLGVGGTRTLCLGTIGLGL